MNILRDYVTEANRIDQLTKTMKSKNIEQSIWDNMNKQKADKRLKREATKALQRIPVTAQRVLDRIEARELAARTVCPKCGCKYLNSRKP